MVKIAGIVADLIAEYEQREIAKPTDQALLEERTRVDEALQALRNELNRPLVGGTST